MRISRESVHQKKTGIHLKPRYPLKGPTLKTPFCRYSQWNSSSEQAGDIQGETWNYVYWEKARGTAAIVVVLKPSPTVPKDTIFPGSSTLLYCCISLRKCIGSALLMPYSPLLLVYLLPEGVS